MHWCRRRVLHTRPGETGVVGVRLMLVRVRPLLRAACGVGCRVSVCLPYRPCCWSACKEFAACLRVASLHVCGVRWCSACLRVLPRVACSGAPTAFVRVRGVRVRVMLTLIHI